MIITMEDGSQWRIIGYRAPKDRERYLSPSKMGVYRSVGNMNVHQFILVPILKEYNFGGLIFRETGEERPPQAGEWSLSYGIQPAPIYSATLAGCEAKILEFVRYEPSNE